MLLLHEVEEHRWFTSLSNRDLYLSPFCHAKLYGPTAASVEVAAQQLYRQSHNLASIRGQTGNDRSQFHPRCINDVLLIKSQPVPDTQFQRHAMLKTHPRKRSGKTKKSISDPTPVGPQITPDHGQLPLAGTQERPVGLHAAQGHPCAVQPVPRDEEVPLHRRSSCISTS